MSNDPTEWLFYNLKNIAFTRMSFWHNLSLACKALRLNQEPTEAFCKFPFKYNNKTYSTCTYDPNELLPNAVYPWCSIETGNNASGLVTKYLNW